MDTYITKNDLTKYIQKNTLSELTNGRKAMGGEPAVAGTDTIWQNLIPTALETVNGFTRHWYDMDKETRKVSLFDDNLNHLENERLYIVDGQTGENTLYLCIKDAPAATLITDTEFFEQKDDRNPILVEITCLLLIHNLSRRGNPRQIPEQRIFDYDNAISRLKEIQKGIVCLDIPTRENTAPNDAGQSFIHGSFNIETTDIY